MAPRGSGIVINIGANGEEAKAVLQMVQNQLRETGAAGKEAGASLAQSLEFIKGAIETAGVAELGMMAMEATAKIKEMIASSVELGMELGHASQETGISAQNMSVLKYASDVTGVSFEALVKGTGRLSKAMLEAEEGKKTAIQSFARLGISQQEVGKHSQDMLGMLGMVADKFQTLPDGPQKSAVALNLFSRAGIGLIPFLNQGSEGIARLAGEAESLGLVLDEDGIAKLEEMHRSSVKLKGSVEGVGLGLTIGLEPALQSTTNALAALISGGKGWVGVGEMMGKSAIYFSIGLTEITKDASLAQDKIMQLVGGAEILEAHAESLVAVTSAQKAAVAAQLAEGHKMVADAKTNAVIAQAVADFTEKTLADGLDPSSPEAKKKGTGSIDLQDQSGGKSKSTDGIAKASASLAQAQAEAIAKIVKDSDNAALAANDAWHKMMLISDEEFYSQKLRLEEQSIDAEETAIKSRQGELQGLLATQQGDKLLKRNKGGQSAEELNTQKELVQLASQLNDLESKRSVLETNASAETQVRAEQSRLATLRIAAQVEEETNTTITARLALMREENSIAIQKAGKDSPEAAQLEALERVKEAKLQIEDVDRQIRDSEADNKRAVEELAHAAAQDPRFKKSAAEQINKLNADEAAQLKVLVAQYDALAQTLGGPFLQTAKQLHTEMDLLNQPNKKGDAQFTKALGDGVTSMAEKIANASMSGKNSFHDMAMSIEKDVIDLAIKLAMNQWLKPLLTGIGSGGGGGDVPTPGMDIYDAMNNGHAAGGYMDSPGIVGEEGPELFFPQGPGTVTPNSFLSQISEGGGGKAPSVTMNVTNASSQPVTARQTGSSYDSEMKQFIIHTVLEDHAQGGPIAQASQGQGS